MMQRFNEAEQAFHHEVREKKKAASGVHSKTGKRGYVGKMMFPTDFMTRKEKYNYRKAGKVIVTNLYDNILTLEEFAKLEADEQRNRLIHWRNNYSSKEVMKGLQIGSKAFYEIVEELDVPKAPRRKAKPIRKNKKVTSKTAEKSEMLELQEMPKTPEAPAVQEIIVDGWQIKYNGTYTPQAIQKRLLNLSALLEEENDDFYIELKVVQKARKEPNEIVVELQGR